MNALLARRLIRVLGAADRCYGKGGQLVKDRDLHGNVGASADDDLPASAVDEPESPVDKNYT